MCSTIIAAALKTIVAMLYLQVAYTTFVTVTLTTVAVLCNFQLLLGQWWYTVGQKIAECDYCK